MTTSFGKKAAAAALAVLTLGAGMTLSAGDAEARGGRKGAMIAAGVIGAVAAGALIAGASNAHSAPAYYYTAPSYAYEPPTYSYETPRAVYYPQQPVVEYGYPANPGYYHRPARRHYGYSETGYAYRGPVCKLRKERVWDGYGWRMQRYQVCR
ncbi:MAG TPA: hypothetical protein PKW21_03780 [Rhabdaerophilum sp.]|nr:hypothetical protein [Rhabdaerophilum sp.]